jgi:hypothetical protein
MHTRAPVNTPTNLTRYRPNIQRYRPPLSLATLPLLHKQKVHGEVGEHNKRTGKHTQPDAVLPQRHHIEPKRAQDG